MMEILKNVEITKMKKKLLNSFKNLVLNLKVMFNENFILTKTLKDLIVLIQI